jgi:hypothetical protein
MRTTLIGITKFYFRTPNILALFEAEFDGIEDSNAEANEGIGMGDY